MSYDEQESRKSRVVVETPTSRREVTQTETARGPERGGVSGATVGVIVVVAIALITILVLFLMNSQNNDNLNENLALQQQQAPPPQTTIVQQPAQQQQPPVIIQQAPAAPAQAPIIINNPPATAGSGTDDGAIQMAIDKRLLDDPNLSTLGITVTVQNGKATLMGTVKSETLKSQIERVIRAVKGVKETDNQITVSSV